MTSILGQVRLLRQIAAEFSSFASSPTARRAPADPVQLVHSVAEPYRVGLEGRIELQNEVAPPLPAVFVDPTLVARALANIIENALHSMPGAGRLRLTASVEDGSWRFGLKTPASAWTSTRARLPSPSHEDDRHGMDANRAPQSN